MMMHLGRPKEDVNAYRARELPHLTSLLEHVLLPYQLLSYSLETDEGE
jgi:hypothetical protein